VKRRSAIRGVKLLVGVAAVVLLSSCAVAPTDRPGEIGDRAAVARLQTPSQQRNVWFRSEDSLFPRSREVLLSDRPVLVANALLSQLKKGPIPSEDGNAVDSEFSSSWKFRAIRFAEGTLSIDVGNGRDIAENAFPLCQMLSTLIDGRTVRSVELFDGGSSITSVRDPNGAVVEGGEPLTTELCNIFYRRRETIKILLVENGRLVSVERQVTGLTDASDPLEWTEQLITALVSGPRPTDDETGLSSDVGDVEPEFRDEGSGYALSFSASFDKLPANRQAMVLAQLLDAIESNVPNKSFGAVAVEVGGIRKSRVAGPAGPIPTPIQRSQYLALFPPAG
jgi:hypothetical protein